jgi:hypothetical protein
VLMRKIYLLVKNDTRTGPFTLKELLAQPLHSGSLIWVIGESEDWLSPLEIPSLQDYFLQDEKGTLSLKEVEIPELKSNHLDNSVANDALNRNGYLDDEVFTGIPNRTERNQSEEEAVIIPSLIQPALKQAKFKGFETVSEKERPIEEEGLGKNKWPLFATISLMVLLIIWSILSNDNGSPDKSRSFTGSPTTIAVEPTSSSLTSMTLPVKEQEPANMDILPVAVPASVASSNTASSLSTDLFLDSVARVLDEQDQLMAAVDAVYKQSFNYRKRSFKSIKSNSTSLVTKAIVTPGNTIESKTDKTTTPTVHQQIDLQSRYIRNGNKLQLSGVEVMVKNNSRQVLKSIGVDVFYYKKGGHLLDKETVYFSNVYPRQSLTMSIPGNQRAISARMQLGTITLAERP